VGAVDIETAQVGWAATWTDVRGSRRSSRRSNAWPYTRVLSAARSAPRIPTLMRVLVEGDRLALLQVFTNASVDGARCLLVVESILIGS
jgi:hypothetical protein